MKLNWQDKKNYSSRLSLLEYYGEDSLKEYWLPQNLTSGFGFPVKGTKNILLLAIVIIIIMRAEFNQIVKTTPSTVPM